MILRPHLGQNQRPRWTDRVAGFNDELALLPRDCSRIAELEGALKLSRNPARARINPQRKQRGAARRDH